MPSLSDYLANFGLKELLLTIFILAVIVVGREERRIFRRKR